MSKIETESFVTLATNDSYCLGALTLAQSLRNSKTTRALSVLITKGVSASFQSQLGSVFDHVAIVDIMNSNDTVNLSLLKRPELGVTFTKLHCWRLTQFTKCVFLDADCLVVQNVDDLFNREEISAATDVGWPDCFNSGVFVFKPSLETYSNLIAHAISQGSFDGGDQGLLNSYFSNWSTSEQSRRLPFLYNMTTNVSYSYQPAYLKYQNDVKIVHFIGVNKPWYNSFNLDTQKVVGGNSEHESKLMNLWWAVFSSTVFETLPEDIKKRFGGQLVRNTTPFNQVSDNNAAKDANQGVQHHHHSAPDQYATGNISGGVVIGSDQHQNLWERGQIEFTGRDSFANIQAHLDSKLQDPKK